MCVCVWVRRFALSCSNLTRSYALCISFQFHVGRSESSRRFRQLVTETVFLRVDWDVNFCVKWNKFKVAYSRVTNIFTYILKFWFRCNFFNEDFIRSILFILDSIFVINSSHFHTIMDRKVSINWFILIWLKLISPRPYQVHSNWNWVIFCIHLRHLRMTYIIQQISDVNMTTQEEKAAKNLNPTCEQKWKKKKKRGGGMSTI